jgi:hypothetical protein
MKRRTFMTTALLRSVLLGFLCAILLVVGEGLTGSSLSPVGRTMFYSFLGLGSVLVNWRYFRAQA